MTPAAASAGQWDVIVIGAGLGGGVAGRALAEAGRRVLFLERGRDGPRQAVNRGSQTPLPEARLVRGLWPEPLHVRLDGQDVTLFAPLGAGPGGSSVFYAATLERPERHDLDDLPGRPHPTGGWPAGYDVMAPWYDAAARQFQLYGSADPLSENAPLPVRDPPELGAVDAALAARLRKAGLHPYHAPTAIARLPGCTMCLGTRCPRPCKMDGRSAGVEPALATGRAHLLDRAHVTRLLPEGDRIAAVEAIIDGQTHRFQAPQIVLAGGALNSPRLLLRSACEGWADGLANRSGLVGRNLMFHINEWFALWPPRGTPRDGAGKAIAFRDLYHLRGQRFGAVQSVGFHAREAEILHYLQVMAARSALRNMPLINDLLRLPAALAARVLGDAQVFVGLLEDLPYSENRVLHDPAHPDRLAVQYHIAPELRDRHRAFRRAIRRALRGQRHLFLGRQVDPNYGHPCGTLRFGHDPAGSVLNAQGRAHDVRNLWVADASFMPTSMGVNPSLTIAAHALRVADAIVKETGS